MSPNRSILIIANPASGRSRDRRTAAAVAVNLRARGLAVTVRHTVRSGDAERIARAAAVDQSERYDCLIACGGDGTMQEVANALASLSQSSGHVGPTMGLAPAGRCNDFARALKIPHRPEAIADVLTHGHPRRVDLGRVNHRYFCTVATIGVDAEVSSYVDSMRVPLTGTIAYLYGALRVLARYQPRNLRIAGDFGVIERPVFLASSANTSSYGGAIPIAPDAVPTDGQLDLCVIEHVARLRAFTLVPTVLAGRHRSLPETRFIRTNRLTIDADEPLQLWADGERIARTPVVIEAAPGAVRIMLPP